MDALDQIGEDVIEPVAIISASRINPSWFERLVGHGRSSDGLKAKSDPAVAGKTVLFTGLLEK